MTRRNPLMEVGILLAIVFIIAIGASEILMAVIAELLETK